MAIFTSFRQPESPIRYQQTDVRAVLDNKDLGIGTVYVSENSLCWQDQITGTRGFSISYLRISLHAISKDVKVHSNECIYILLDSRITLTDYESNNVQEKNEDDSSDEESVIDISELVLAPNNPALVPLMYEAIKVCQALNPDPIDYDEDEEEDNMFADAEDHNIIEMNFVNFENENNEFQEQEQNHEHANGEHVNGAGGDSDINNLAHRFENQVIQYDDANEDEGFEQFEDAD